jgi:hypothetical protein
MLKRQFPGGFVLPAQPVEPHRPPAGASRHLAFRRDAGLGQGRRINSPGRMSACLQIASDLLHPRNGVANQNERRRLRAVGRSVAPKKAEPVTYLPSQDRT